MKAANTRLVAARAIQHAATGVSQSGHGGTPRTRGGADVEYDAEAPSRCLLRVERRLGMMARPLVPSASAGARAGCRAPQFTFNRSKELLRPVVVGLQCHGPARVRQCQLQVAGVPKRGSQVVLHGPVPWLRQRCPPERVERVGQRGVRPEGRTELVERVGIGRLLL